MKFLNKAKKLCMGLNHVIITGAEFAFGTNIYFIMYADGTVKEIDVNDEALEKIEPVIIHNELNQILLSLWEKDKSRYDIEECF